MRLQTWISPEEYIEREEHSDERWEYRDGQMYSLSGGTPAHSSIQVNLGSEISRRLRGSTFRVFPNSLRMLIQASGVMTHADLSIYCDEPQEGAYVNSFVNPAVLIEVLSLSTQHYEQGRKFDQYRLIPTLREYILVMQDEHAVDHYVKQADGGWRYIPLRGESAVLEIFAAGVAVPFSEIYYGIAIESGDGIN